MIVIGLTGGIGSGKSTVQKYLTSKNIPVMDADQIAKKIVKPGCDAWIEIVKIFGNDILHEDDSLNRKALSNLVFSNKDKLDILNKIMHKRVLEEINKQLKNITTPIVVIDAPLLIEAGFNKIADEVWVMDLEPQLQIERVRRRDNLSEEAIKKRMSFQLPREKRKQHADVIIDNSGTIEDLHKQIDKELARIG